MNQLKQIVFAPTKQITKDFYFFHIVGTPTAYRYIIESQMLQVVLMGLVVQQFRVPMTYEDFEREIKTIYKVAINKLCGKN